jgi:biotin carboxylase
VPPVDVLTRVNSKTWSNTLVQKLGLPGCARVVRSVEELSSAAQEFAPSVVVKDPYGVSGRGALRVNSPGVLRAVQRVLSRQEGEGRYIELLVQPELSKKCDFSGHLQVNRDGTSRFLGVQVMVNHGFRHLGSGPAGPELTALLDRHGYRDVLADVGAALADEGYHGPVGVDSMVLDDNTVVPVLEINARRSMGLLALLAGHRAAHTGLTCHLWQLGLTLGTDQSVEDVLSALREVRLLYLGGARPGVLVLGGGSLSERDGRLYGLSYCATDDAPLWHERVTEAVSAAGMKPRRTGHAA